MKRRHIGAAVIAGLVAIGSTLAAAADNTPVRIVVPFTAGSGSDEGARFYGNEISKVLGRPVIVDNRPGGSGLVAVRAVLSAPADGTTILLGSNSLVAVNPVTVKDLAYDPFTDLVPLHGLAVSAPGFLTGMDSGINSIEDIVAKYKKTGEPISIGNFSEGYALVSEWLCQTLEIKCTLIRYKGGAQMMTDVIGGRLDLGLNSLSGVIELEKSNRLKVLAITGAGRDKQLPHVPTMIELGYPGFETYVWSSFYMKAGTDPQVLAELAEVIAKVQQSEAAQAYQAQRAGEFLNKGLDDLGNFQTVEYNRFKSIAEKAGIAPK